MVDSLANHIVDSSHDKSVQFDCHRLFNTIIKHCQKAIELFRITETFFNLHFSERQRNLKSGFRIVEFNRNGRFIENVWIVRLSVYQFP